MSWVEVGDRERAPGLLGFKRLLACRSGLCGERLADRGRRLGRGLVAASCQQGDREDERDEGEEELASVRYCRSSRFGSWRYMIVRRSSGEQSRGGLAVAELRVPGPDLQAVRLVADVRSGQVGGRGPLRQV
jgi:hypothetical protein